MTNKELTMPNDSLKHCKQCRRYKHGYCKKVGYMVSLNANFCEYYKDKLIIKLKALCRR